MLNNLDMLSFFFQKKIYLFNFYVYECVCNTGMAFFYLNPSDHFMKHVLMIHSWRYKEGEVK